MYINVLQLLFLGFIINSSSVSGKEKVHIKIHVPEFIKHHTHTKIVFIKKKGGHGHGHGHDDHGHGKKKVHVVIHKHDHSHKHKHDHGHKHGHKHDAKHGHKHAHKGEHKHTHIVKKGHGGHHGHHHKKHEHKPKDHHKHSFERDDFFPDDYSTTLRSHRSEQYNYETVKNPQSPNPFVVKSSYKVSEKDPYDHTTKGYHQQYQYPPLPLKPDAYKYSQLIDHYKENENENDNTLFPPYNTQQVKEEEEEAEPEDGEEYQDYQESAGLDDPKNFLNYDYSPPTETQSYESASFDYDGPTSANLYQHFKLAPPSAPAYHNYKIDGPGLDQYLNEEYGGQNEASSKREKKVPFNKTQSRVPDKN